jgi:hypothetical protein
MKTRLALALALGLLGVPLSASTLTCSFSGAASSSNCYGNGIQFGTDDTLSLLSLGSATQGPVSMANGSISGTTANGVGVQFSLGPGGTTLAGGLVDSASIGQYLARADNTEDIWATDHNGHFAWDGPGDSGPAQTPNFNAYDGHFNAPTAHVIGTEASGAWGDYLIGPALANGGPANGTLVLNFSQSLAAVGFQISSVSNGTANTSFMAELDAYDGNVLLGSYLINAGGSGGVCAGLNPSPNPVPCNDAPLLAYSDPNHSITKVVVYAIDATGDYGFLIGNLVAQDAPSESAPEPAGFVLGGGGLLLLGVLAKRSRPIQSA